MAGLRAFSCLSPEIFEVTKFMLRDIVQAFGFCFIRFDFRFKNSDVWIDGFHTAG